MPVTKSITDYYERYTIKFITTKSRETEIRRKQTRMIKRPYQTVLCRKIFGLYNVTLNLENEVYLNHH